MSEEKLKACPFCGGEAVSEVYCGEHAVTCSMSQKLDSECPLYEMYTFNDKQEAIDKWNRRPSDGE